MSAPSDGEHLYSTTTLPRLTTPRALGYAPGDGVRALRSGAPAAPRSGGGSRPRRASPAHARARARRGLRPPRLQVRLVGRAPLPGGVLAPLGVRDISPLRRRTHPPAARRFRDLEPDAARQRAGPHRRAGRDARPPERGPLRV